MAKYQVIFKGVARSNPGGVQAFLSRFGEAYGMSAGEAREFIRTARAVLYVCDDQDSASKSRRFLEGLGGVAEIRAVADGAPAQDPAASPHPSPVSPSSVPPELEDDAAWGPAAAAIGTVAAVTPAAPGPEGGPMEAEAGATRPAADARSPRACPKCGCFMPVGPDECPACHVFISKYEKAMARKAAGLRDAPPASTGARPAPVDAGAGGYGSGGGSGMEEAAAAALLPEARNALLFALGGLVVFLSFILAPVAIYKGFQALETLKLNPELKGKGLALAGIILGASEVVGLIFGVLMSRGII